MPLLRGHVRPSGLFENTHPKEWHQTDAGGHNHCRMPSFREAWQSIALTYQPWDGIDNLGRSVHVDGIKPRVESAYGSSA